MMMMMKNMVMMMMMMMIICHQMGCVSGREVVVSKGEGERAMKLKIGSIGVLLVAGAVGVSLPLIGRKIPALRPENDIFFMVKAFAAGVILCTGFVHILPDAFESFNSPCLEGSAVQRFPFAGLVAMLSAIGTLMMDTLATGYYERQHFMKTKQVNVEEEDEEHAGHVHVHTHATHGHSHGSSSPALLRRRIVSQVLEVGIVVHSVIIGISLGTAQSVETIKPLMAALSFHQLFEGLGLGGCLSQAEFKWRSTVIMGTLFTVTAPVGIGVGIGVWKTTYNSEKEDSREAMLICGVFNAASSGILIYMALVDLLAADFMNPRLLSNLRLQLAANLSLLLGAASMSLLANWA